MSHSVASSIVAQDMILQDLLTESVLIGGIFTMGYDSCLVLTNDLWKKRAGGVPQHCFLLATAMVPGKVPDPDDEELILLRVVGPASLPDETELVQVRAEAMREMVTADGEAAASSTPAILDVLTRNEIQFSGVQAKVLGTFFESHDGNGRPVLRFGSDVETFYSSSRYKVYKPYGASLAQIVNYPESSRDDTEMGDEVVRYPEIGEVRYTSTSRRRTDSTLVNTRVPVRVNIEDFIALKTAIFGMTRLGKSNTMKTIATGVAQYAALTNQRIGQLLFDPAGEYANVNVQDETALSQIGPEFVTIFRYGTAIEGDGVRSLKTNFYNEATIAVTWAIIRSFLAPKERSVNYIGSFLAADVLGPDDQSQDYSAYNWARRRRSLLFATLVRAGFTLPRGFSTRIVVNKDVIASVNEHQLDGDGPAFETGSGGTLELKGEQLVPFWNAISASAGSKSVKEWIEDPELQAILAVYRGSVGSGFRLLEPMRVYHSPDKASDYADDILAELVSGKIVIVDLSLGSESVLQFCSERIVNHIVQDAAQRFASGDQPHQIQIFVEEAHRLFNRERMSHVDDVDPYVRLAKEAAKYKLGLIYATQEVSSVDPIILSNTSNWIVTHLNNHSEVRELSKYYDFADFSDLTLKAEDVGFARIKTRSGRFIIPTQIALFDGKRVEDARAACLASLQGRSEES